MIQKNADYLRRARSRMLAQYQGLPRMDALLQAFETEVQALEDAAFEMLIDRELQNNLATGDLLDKLGALVGQPREGFSDIVYNRLIRARIAANRSDGRRAALIKVALLLTPGVPTEVREYVGAAVVTSYGPVIVPPYVIANDFIRRSVAAGVRPTFVWIGTPLTTTLIWGYKSNGGGGITQPTIAQSPGYFDGGVSGGFYIAGGNAAGAVTSDGGSTT